MQAIEFLRPYHRPLGLLGSAMLLIGIFFPIVNYAAVGGYSFLGYSILLALLLLVISIVSATLAAVQAYRGLWVTGGLAAAVCVYVFAQIEMSIGGARQAHSVFDMLVSAATTPTSVGAGWVVLFPSVALMLLVAGVPEAKPKPVVTATTAAVKPQVPVAAGEEPARQATDA